MRTHAPAKALAGSVTVVAAVGTAIVTACVLSLALRGRGLEVMLGLWITLNGPAGILSLWIAALVLQRRPGHGAGRILLAVGVLSVLHVMVATWADIAATSSGLSEPLDQVSLTPAELPLSASIPLLGMNILWVPIAVLGALLVAYFPDGHLPGRRWRWIPASAAVAALVLMTACAIDAWPTVDWSRADTPPALGALFLLGGTTTLAVILGGAISFGLRWRAADQSRRSFEAVGGVLIVVTLVSLISYPWAGTTVLLLHAAFAAALGTYGAAVARYRLHGVEPVVGKRLAASTLSVVIVGGYVGTVIGTGAVVSQHTAHPAIPLIVVAIAAMLVAPAHRVTRWAIDRLLYGSRPERVEVLAHVAASRGTTQERDAMADLAELLRRGTGASRVEIDVTTGEGPILATAGPAAVLATVAEPPPAEPPPAEPPSAEPPSAGRPPGPAPYARAIVSDGQNQGEIRVFAHAAGDLRADATSIVDDVARMLSVLLENSRLSRVLAGRLEQTQASRQRLVEAQDQARRALERDIHDGAQAQLIAIRIHLGDLERRARTGQIGDLTMDLSRVGAEVDSAVRQLRDLARGLHPPTLEQLGVGPAVQAFVRDAALPVSLTLTGAERHPQAAESAAYFACIEAIQNALRHSAGAAIAVVVSADATHLGVTVSDTGPGFDPAAVAHRGLANLTDRIAAVGGEVGIASAPGAGACVTVTIPAQSETAER